MSTDLARLPDAHDLAQYQQVSEVILKSGLFPDTKSAFQAGVKAMAGRELGLGPFASQNAFDIIEGKLSMSANIIAARIKADPRYDYRVAALDRKGCTIRFLQDGEPIGEFTFDEQDREAAGLRLEVRAKSGNGMVSTPWKTHPKAMFFARAISQGARVFCPDIFYGVPVYVPGELPGTDDVPPDLSAGVASDGYGEAAGPVVEPDVSSSAPASGDLEPDPQPIEDPPRPETPRPESLEADIAQEFAEPYDPLVSDSPPQRPRQPPSLTDEQAAVVRETGKDLARAERKATKAQLAKLAILAHEIGFNDDERHYHAGVDSFTELSRVRASELIEAWQSWGDHKDSPDVQGGPTSAIGEGAASGTEQADGEGAESEADGLDEDSAPTLPLDGPATSEQFDRALELASRLPGKPPRVRCQLELSRIRGGPVNATDYKAATRAEMAEIITALMDGGVAGR